MAILAKQQLKQGIRWIIGSGTIATISIVGLLGYTFLFQRTPAPIQVSTTTIKRDRVEQTINESGRVELADQQTLKAPSDSTVDRVLVRVGQAVRAGQEAIILRNSDRETRLQEQMTVIEQTMIELARDQQRIQAAEQKLATEQQQIQIQELEFAERQLNLHREQQRVEEKQADLKDTEEELENLQKLADKGFISGDQLRDQHKQVRAAEIAVRDAQLKVETDSLTLQRDKLERATQRQTAIADATSQLQEAQLNLEMTKLQLQRQELELRKIEQELQNTLITVPIDGIILDVKVQSGNGVALGNELLTIGDPSQEYVRLSLSTLNAAKVQLNQLARITIIGPDSPTYDGQVVSLSPQAIAPSEQQGGGQASVSATIQLNQPTGTLIPGSQVNVEIILEQRKDVIVASLEVLQRSGNESFVWVKDAQGLAQKREVTLGLEGLAEVEVISGLKSGDQVILPSPDVTLKPGLPVASELEDREK